MVDLLLVVAVDLEGNRLVELELRAAIQRNETLAVEEELDSHHGAGFAPVDLVSLLAVAADLADARIRENRDVEVRGVFTFLVEPKAGNDLLRGERHDLLLNLVMGLRNQAALASCAEPQQDSDFGASSYSSWRRHHL